MDEPERNILSIKQVTDYSSSQFLKAIELYIELFPPEERKNIDDIKKLLNKGIYRLLILHHNMNQETIGFALIMINENPAFMFIDNIAIARSHQGSGYGTEFIRLLVEMQNDLSMGVLVEVERPEMAVDHEDSIVREKRLTFYRQLAFEELRGIDYQFPVQGHDPLPLVLMFRPAEGLKTLSSSNIEQMIKAVYHNIHSEQDNLAEIFQSFADTITDQVFSDC